MATIHPSIHPSIRWILLTGFKLSDSVLCSMNGVGWGPAFDLKDSPIEQFRSRQDVQWKSIVCYFHLMHGSLGNYGKGWIAKEINRMCAVVDLDTPGCKGDIVDLHSDTGIPTGANKAWEKQRLVETFCETPKDGMAISGIYIWNPTCHEVLGGQVQGVKPS